MKKLYHKGSILTMDDRRPTVEAVLVEDGAIIATGNYKDISEQAGEFLEIDLEGKTMMPAFIDAHGHFSATANLNLQVSLADSKCFKEIEESLELFVKERGIDRGKWVNGRGYDQNGLEEKSHPSKETLDRCCPDNPAVIQHASGHMGVFNSKALEVLGVDKNTLAPAGGLIDFSTGYMEENAFVEYLRKIPMPSIDDFLEGYRKAQDYYASFGITTIQEGLMVKEMLPFYRQLIERGLLKLDVIGYCDIKDADTIVASLSNSKGKYDRGFKIGGYKVFLDGSPQGRTAWMREPYEGEESYCGYGTMTDEELKGAIEGAVGEKHQLIAHCNGDRAVEQYLACIRSLSEERDISQIRPVIIHAQLIGVDQLDSVKELELIPSFFVGHIYHWGDIHIENFGYERASMISPVRSSFDRKIIATFHQDTPVTPPNMLESVWCAVNRLTKSGRKLCQSERVDVASALKAVTINSAYQYFEEGDKGSIVAGKRADFVILDKNPLKVDPMDIRHIEVLETIKDGETIYLNSYTKSE